MYRIYITSFGLKKLEKAAGGMLHVLRLLAAPQLAAFCVSATLQVFPLSLSVSFTLCVYVCVIKGNTYCTNYSRTRRCATLALCLFQSILLGSNLCNRTNNYRLKQTANKSIFPVQRSVGSHPTAIESEMSVGEREWELRVSSPVNSTDLSWGTLVQLIKCKSVNKPQVAIVFSSLQSQSGVVRTQLSQFRFGVDNVSLLNGRPHTYYL